MKNNTLNVNNFRNWWNKHHPNIPPFGHMLRQAYPDRWIRVHTLAGGKRYAGSDEERAEILHRQNTIGEHVFGIDTEFFVILTATQDPGSVEALSALKFTAERDWNLSYSTDADLSEDIAAYTFYVSRSSLKNSTWNMLFLRIANDELDPLIMVNAESGNICSPYDGGVDIITATSADSVHIKNQFKTWLSTHEDGL